MALLRSRAHIGRTLHNLTKRSGGKTSSRGVTMELLVNDARLSDQTPYTVVVTFLTSKKYSIRGVQIHLQVALNPSDIIFLTLPKVLS